MQGHSVRKCASMVLLIAAACTVSGLYWRWFGGKPSNETPAIRIVITSNQCYIDDVELSDESLLRLVTSAKERIRKETQENERRANPSAIPIYPIELVLRGEVSYYRYDCFLRQIIDAVDGYIAVSIEGTDLKASIRLTGFDDEPYLSYKPQCDQAIHWDSYREQPLYAHHSNGQKIEYVWIKIGETAIRMLGQSYQSPCEFEQFASPMVLAILLVPDSSDMRDVVAACSELQRRKGVHTWVIGVDESPTNRCQQTPDTSRGQ